MIYLLCIVRVRSSRYLIGIPLSGGKFRLIEQVYRLGSINPVLPEPVAAGGEVWNCGRRRLREAQRGGSDPVCRDGPHVYVRM